jgi:hypothetical protein
MLGDPYLIDNSTDAFALKGFVLEIDEANT